MVNLLEPVNKSSDSLLGLKKVYVLYEISSSLIVSIDTAKNFFSIMNILSTRLETKKGALITLKKSGKKKKDELLFGFDEEDIKSHRYSISDDVIRNVAYTKDIVFLIKSETGTEAKGAQMMNFIDRNIVQFICVPVLDENEKTVAIFVVDRLFGDETPLEKDIFFMRSIATAISKNIKLKKQVETERELLLSENERLKQELRVNYKLSNIISVSESVLRVIETVKQVANSGTPILLTGDVGTGKELIAKALHYNSWRLGSAFSKIHCGALPEPLLAIELFGNEVTDEFSMSQYPGKRGKFETADGGSLYLDSIESMSLPTQAKLLKYLTDGEFEMEGSGKTVTANTRVIASTTKDLRQLVANGDFLDELHHELNIIHIELPSLKDRKEDIPLLVKYFIKRFSKENSKKVSGVSQEVLDKLMSYDWPYNVRELENCIKRMIVMTSGKILDDTLLPGSIKNIIEEKEKQYEGGVEEVVDGILRDKLEKIVGLFSMQSRRKKKSALYKKITDNIDRILIELSLKKCNSTQIDAAAFLGINRNTLRAKIEKLKINSNNIKESNNKNKNKRNLDLPFR